MAVPGVNESLLAELTELHQFRLWYLIMIKTFLQKRPVNDFSIIQPIKETDLNQSKSSQAMVQ